MFLFTDGGIRERSKESANVVRCYFSCRAFRASACRLRKQHRSNDIVCLVGYYNFFLQTKQRIKQRILAFVEKEKEVKICCSVYKKNCFYNADFCNIFICKNKRRQLNRLNNLIFHVKPL